MEKIINRIMRCGKCIPARIVLTLLGFLAITVIYSHRVVLNVAIVAMVNNTAIQIAEQVENSSFSAECPDTSNHNTTRIYKGGKYIWNQKSQGIILGSFYYGYSFSQFLGGWLSFKLGPKRVFTSTVLLSSIMVLLTPLGAELGILTITCFRVIIGLTQGLTYPAVYTLFARWAPVKERTTLVSVCACGNQVGTVLAMSLTGFLCEYGFAGGWPSSFYVLGTAGCVISTLLMYFVYDTPSEHPRIESNEFEYIKSNISHTSLHSMETPKIPWKDILTSRPVWAIAVAKFCWSWGFYTLLSKLPSYLDIVLHFPIEQNGLVNALVYVCNSVSLVLSGYLSDFLLKKEVFKLSTVRKFCETVGLLGPGVSLIVIPFLGCDIFSVIALLTFAMTLFGFIGGGDMVAVVDIAPEFAGTIFGLTNGIACIPGFLAPYVAGIFLDEIQGSMTQWSYIFFISSGFYAVGIITFLIMGSVEVQSWAMKIETKTNEKNYTEEKKERFQIQAEMKF